ncbi:MAG: hypothetical protein GX197_03940 [Firmicutes bacterium]|nr:hypothetical protein [Bacillota bacterium]
MRKIKKLVSLIVALGILMGSTLLFAAKDQSPTPKDETVYGILAADGTVKEIYVVNGFSLDKPGTIVDFGDYTEVSNLTTTEEIKNANKQIRVAAGKGRFFYQGKLAKTELPWRFKISYRLDGREITAQELAGKSGLWELVLEIKKNPHVDPWYYENMTLQVFLTLDTEKFSEIKTEGATIVSAGKDKQLNYTVFPGREQTITLSAKVNAFSLPPVQFSGIMMQLPLAGENLDTLTASFAEFKSGLAELDRGAQKLQTGTGELADGLQVLAGGGQQLASGLKQLQANMHAFAEGTGKLSSAAAEVDNGASQLSTGLTQLARENDALLAGAEQIFAALLASANAQLEPLLKQLQSLNVTVEPLTAENYAVVLADLSTRLPQLPGGSAYVSMLSALKSQLDGYKQFYQGLQNYTDGVAQMAEAGSNLTAGTQALKNGVETLGLHAAEFAGAVSLIATNAEKLNTGLYNVYQGSLALNEVARQLAEGTGEFNRQTVNLDENLFASALDSLREPAGPIKSFVSPQNTAVQTLQFILRTEEISAPQTAKDKTEITESATKQTFWQKLLNLFNFS